MGFNEKAFRCCFALFLVAVGSVDFTDSQRVKTSIMAPKNARKLQQSRLIKTYELNDKVISAFVDDHNFIRSNVKPQATNMRRMSWDKKLAKISSDYSKKCVFAVNRGNKPTTFRRIDENMFVSTAQHDVNSSFVSSAVKAWEGEKVNYDFIRNRCTPGKECDHYKQVVWGESFKIGCGVSKCSAVSVEGKVWQDVLLIVCYYGPGGNWINGQPYKPVKGIALQNGTNRVCGNCHYNDTCSDNLCTNHYRENQQKVPVWSAWTPWTECSVTCGNFGRRKRVRFCSSFIDSECGGRSRQTEYNCNRRPCGRTVAVATGYWTRWKNWSSCTRTCGGGNRLRTRSCSTGNIKDCPIGSSRMTIGCNRQPCAAWSPWRSWERCSKSCGGGIRKRTRACNSGSDSDCSGSARIEEACNSNSCGPGQERVTKWSAWSKCSTSCNRGERFRTRKCTVSNCGALKLKASKHCFRQSCPRSVRKWSKWSEWSQCNKPCGTGSQRRRRSCVGTIGSQCRGLASASRQCSTSPCANRQQWSSWSSWSVCSKACGIGSRSRSRTCKGGQTCQGLASGSQRCNTQRCVLAPPKWSKWGPWDTCTRSCGIGLQRRKRTCSRVRACPGLGSGIQRCNTPRCARVQPKWSKWSAWSTCSCGSGTQTRRRTCNGVGRRCQGVGVARKSCSTATCPHWSAWSTLQNERGGSSCSASRQVRTRTCSTGNDKDCCNSK